MFETPDDLAGLRRATVATPPTTKATSHIDMTGVGPTIESNPFRSAVYVHVGPGGNTDQLKWPKLELPAAASHPMSPRKLMKYA